MTSKEIQKIKRRIAGFIDSRRLRDAIKELKELARQRQAWDVIDKVEQTESNYAYMLQYVSDGINDPERANVYDGIVIDLYQSLDALVFLLEKTENTSAYFSAIRTYDRNPDPNRIARLIDAYKELADKLSIFSLVASGDGNKDEKENRAKQESVQSELFSAIWTTPRLSSADAEKIEQVLGSDGNNRELSIHLLFALMMGLMQGYDPSKLQLLMQTYLSDGDIKTTSAALIGILFTLWLYGNRPLGKKIDNILSTIKDRPAWQSDLRIAFIEMIRARDTERINRKIQNEVIPDMMNLRPELMDKINGGEINLNDISLQENPEWQELLDKNGITDKLKELTEIQMEGGDVMMSTFAHLKTFPFFNDISNWFLPFSINNTHVSGIALSSGILGDMIENATFMCDNDKYSFMFALNMVPANQRDLMTSQFKAQSDEIYQSINEASQMVAPDARRKAVNSLMQTIYRFFKLYRRKDEFLDPFAKGVNLTTVPALASDFNDPDLLQVVAEFYFKLGYMKEALDTWLRLEDIEKGDAQRYQKMGYCAEKLRNYNDAIQYYQRAELLDTLATWTAKRLAACYRAIGNKDMALKYYKILADQNPDDLKVALLLGYVLVEKGDYAQAIQEFYKVEFLDEKSDKAWRPLAWTLFLTGDFDASKVYYEKIAGAHPTTGDYLNMGHVALASGDMRQAINDYRLSIQTNGNDTNAFRQSMADDTPHLIHAGVSPSLIPLVADAVLYHLK